MKDGVWRVMGLANLRNTCYFNSILQLLLSSGYMQERFGGQNCQSMGQSSLTAAVCELFQMGKSSGEIWICGGC